MKKIKIFIYFILLLLFSYMPVHAQEINPSNSSLIILFNNSNIDNNVKKFIIQSGGQVISEFQELGSIEVKCNPNLIPKIQKYSSVDSISPNHKIKLSQEKMIQFKEIPKIKMEKYDLYNAYQWDIKKVTNNGKSFNLESGNHNVVVGIIDSGVNKNHPDLKDNFLGGENFIPKGFEDDRSETGDPNDIEDRYGHGTHIAGTIAGNGRIKGIAPNIGFKSYRIFNSQGDTTATIVSSAILKATSDGVKVINLSIEGYDFKGNCFWTDSLTNKTYELDDTMAEYSLYSRAIKYAIKQGVTVVASAGNQSLNCSDRNKITEYLNHEYANQGFKYEGLGYEFPGGVKGVITVSSTGPEDKLASYSNYGWKFIDIAAPGGDFINGTYDMCFSTYKDGYSYMLGTSAAAPKVSAVAALIICKYGNLDPKDVAKKIYKSSKPLGNNNCSEYFGYGLVNAYNALSK